MTGFVTSGGDTSGLPFQPVEAHTDTLVAMSDETRPPGSVQVKILTVSDGVIEGTREDRSGAVLADRVEAEDWTLVARTACADGVNEVANALKDLASGFHGLIITTGGTGFGPRDLTPEGTSAVIDREAEPAPATPGSPPSEHTLVTERPAAPDAPAAPSEAVPVVGLRFGQ